MNHVNIEYPHIQKLFEYILAEVFSSGGDGDCIVISKWYNAKELADTFYKYINNLYPNSYYQDTFGDRYTISDRSNESWEFTNDLFIPIPSWAQCVIRI